VKKKFLTKENSTDPYKVSKTQSATTNPPKMIDSLLQSLGPGYRYRARILLQRKKPEDCCKEILGEWHKQPVVGGCASIVAFSGTIDSIGGLESSLPVRVKGSVPTEITIGFS
jgi:hypothetical protein